MAVVNIKHDDYDVYIGRGIGRGVKRGFTWGNPFVLGKDGNRKQVIVMYEDHLITELLCGDKTQEQLKELNGKRLGCYCAPKECHGDILERYSVIATSMNDLDFLDHLYWRKACMKELFELNGIKRKVKGDGA